MKKSSIVNEKRDTIGDPELRLAAERLAIKCGLRADLKGFKCLIDAAVLFSSDCCDGFCEIYRTIGELHGLKPKSVMREIAYAITQSFDLPAKLSALVHINITEADIHNALVIAYLGKLLNNPDPDDDK